METQLVIIIIILSIIICISFFKIIKLINERGKIVIDFIYKKHDYIKIIEDLLTLKRLFKDLKYWELAIDSCQFSGDEEGFHIAVERRNLILDKIEKIEGVAQKIIKEE
jgi:hypothetical protein